MANGGRARGAVILKPRLARRKTREERSTDTRDALIRAAIDLITACGYAATTTSLVAGRAGVSRGALQHHFKSRDELVFAVWSGCATSSISASIRDPHQPAAGGSH